MLVLTKGLRVHIISFLCPACVPGAHHMVVCISKCIIQGYKDVLQTILAP